MQHFWLGFEKRALLRSEVELQPQQERVKKKLEHSGGLLVYHGLGSGKTLTSLNAAQGLKDVDVVVPASLRNNYRKEVEKHTTGFKPHIMSYEAATKNPEREGDMLIVDEAHNLGHAESGRSQALQHMARNYDKRLLLTGSPIRSHPHELGPLFSALRKDRAIPVDPATFNSQYVQEELHNPGFFARLLKGAQPGVTYRIKNRDKLKKLVTGYVDYHPSSKQDFPSVSHEMIEEEMSPEQSQYYSYLMGKASPALRYKIQNGLPPSKAESKALNSFMSGVRQVSNTTRGFGGEGKSPKIMRAVAELEKRHKSDPNFRGVVYSNYLDSGVKAYSEELAKKGISHGVYSGELSEKKRKQLVEDYNGGKVSTLLLSSAGGTGLDLKGTKLVQLMDPGWHSTQLEQAMGRAIRYKSHAHLPEEERHVHVQNYVSLAPQSMLSRIVGKKRDMSSDQYLYDMNKRKDALNNQFLDVLKEVGEGEK